MEHKRGKDHAIGYSQWFPKLVKYTRVIYCSYFKSSPLGLWPAERPATVFEPMDRSMINPVRAGNNTHDDVRLSSVVVAGILGSRVVAGRDHQPERETTRRHVGQRSQGFHDARLRVDREVRALRRVAVVVVGQLVPHVAQFPAVQIIRPDLQRRAAYFLVARHRTVIRVLGEPLAALGVHERRHVVVDVDHLNVQLYRTDGYTIITVYGVTTKRRPEDSDLSTGPRKYVSNNLICSVVLYTTNKCV